MNGVYVTWYHNWARLLVLGIVPFSAICLINYKIYKVENRIIALIRLLIRSFLSGQLHNDNPYIRSGHMYNKDYKDIMYFGFCTESTERTTCLLNITSGAKEATRQNPFKRDL